MSPAMSVKLLVSLLILATRAQGIRLEEQSLDALNKRAIHDGMGLTEAAGGDGGALIYKYGKARKLMITKTMIISKFATIKTQRDKSNETDIGGEESQHSRKNLHVAPPEAYFHEMIDIESMDYSPAKRKPPIHN